MAWGSSGEVFLGEDLIHTRNYSDETARVIDEEVESILRRQEERCKETLSEHRKGLDLVARALLEHETIDGSEVTRLIKLAGGTIEPTDGDGDRTPVDIGPGQGPDAPVTTPSDAYTSSPATPPPAPPN